MEARRQAAQAGLDDVLEWFLRGGGLCRCHKLHKKATGLGQICLNAKGIGDIFRVDL